MDIQKEMIRYSDEIREIRRAIHRHPELGNEEWHTAELIERHLRDLGIETKRLLDTAVVGLLRGGGDAGSGCGSGKRRTVALRADMDALPVQEMTGAEFSSEIDGRMHACGHDVHMAAALGAAGLLSDHRNQLKGDVVFLFQPDEEGSGGAERMIAAGCMDGVEAVFGAHVDPDLPSGHIGIRYGKFYAASDMFRVIAEGVSSHGAQREKGRDALAAAAEMVTALIGLPAKITDDKCVLTVGRMESGTAGNIMPGEAVFEGIIRTLGPETREAMETAFRSTVAEIAGARGVKAQIKYRKSYPGIVNDDGMSALAERAAKKAFGSQRVKRIGDPLMTTEDFGYYLGEAPGCFYHIGAGCSKPLHNPAFLPDEEAAVRLAVMHAAVVLEYLDCPD